MKILVDGRTLRVGWRFLPKWPRVVRAARRYSTHGLVQIGAVPIYWW